MVAIGGAVRTLHSQFHDSVISFADYHTAEFAHAAIAQRAFRLYFMIGSAIYI